MKASVRISRGVESLFGTRDPLALFKYCRNFSGRQHTNLGGSGDSSLHLHRSSALARIMRRAASVSLSA
jgi:hypothetical protein